MRPEGFYWIRLDNDPQWEPAEFRNGQWDLLGSECSASEDGSTGFETVTEVGIRIEPPC